MNGDKTLPYSTLDTEEFREAAREEAAVLLQSTVDMVGVCPEEGFDSVTDDPRLERAFALIREVVTDSFQRGKNAGIAELVKAAGGVVSIPVTTTFESSRQRAPSGSAPALIARVLSEVGDQGSTAINIKDRATTEFERMVSISAIRNELKIGERSIPQRYRQVGGVWYLPDRAPRIKAVG